MNLFKKLLCAAGVALSMVGNANAGVVLNNWIFNPTGAGGAAGGQVISEYLDIVGNAFIQLTPTSASSFTFVEHAVFNIPYADGSGIPFPGGYATATFVANGTGNFSGAFQFTSGQIKIYQSSTFTYGSAAGTYGADPGAPIAVFDVQVGGGGIVDGTGNPISSGQVSVFAKASTPGGLTAGHFFRGNGNDLSLEDVLSFSLTGAAPVGNPKALLVTEVACGFAGFSGPGCPAGTYANAPGQYFFVGNSGSFKLAEVPEPGSLALFGIAILGAGVASRKRKA